MTTYTADQAARRFFWLTVLVLILVVSSGFLFASFKVAIVVAIAGFVGSGAGMFAAMFSMLAGHIKF